MMKKSDLRKWYREKRAQLTALEKHTASEQITSSFLSFFAEKKLSKVHVFLSILRQNEIDTQLLIDSLLKDKIRVFVPKLIGENMISVELLPTTTIKVNSWGIPEPTSNEAYTENDYDAVITPLLYCDHQGNRVGYGKGFYDEFFSSLSPEVLKIGLNYFPPLHQISDVRPEDVALDYLVLPNEVLSFGSFKSKSTK